MKQRVIALLMVITIISWLTTEECKAQKLTEIGNYAGCWYWDANGDGKLENLRESGWVDANGNTVVEIQGVNGDSVFLIDDFNGDETVDFVGSTHGYDENGKWRTPVYVYLSNGTTYEKTITPLEEDELVCPCVVDINHDGRKDVFFYRTNGQSYTPSVFIQTIDHRFLYEELSVVTDEKELDNLQFSTGGNGTYTISGGVSSLSFLNGMFAYSREMSFDLSEAGARTVTPLGEEEYSDIAIIDINNDGFPDIISTNYPTLLSLPDGRYYAGSLTGKVAVADINSDGLKDIVHFNTTTNTVKLYLSQDGKDYKEKKLIDNGSITGMYCQDFDGDGLTDIMLQAASDSYSFIVFFKNKGNGEFTKKENMLTGDYVFSKPYDFNNDGRGAVLAACYLRGYANKRTGFDSQLKLLTWDSSLSLSEEDVIYNESQLYSLGDWNYHTQSWTYPPFVVADFDGDGVLEVICSDGDFYYATGVYLYSPFSPSANTAPLQMTTPNVVYDKQSGYVKVEWLQGSDKETASSDLTYTVRMGTTDGSQDLMVYDAGVSRYCVANTGTWEKGTVYVSIRAVDANGKSGEWSPSATFEVETQSAEFTLHNKDLGAECFTTIDTLVVRSLNGKSLTYQLPDDGKIILQKGDSAYVTFSNYGEKTIVASIEGGNTVSHSLTVLPIKKTEDITPNYLNVFDLSTNGTTEGISGGIYTFEDGIYSKLGTMFNSDITQLSYPVFVDKTMNGLPDVYSTNFIKNGVKYNWLINRGDLEFEVEQDTGGPVYGYDNRNYLKFVDLNNDGFMDYVSSYSIYINQGDYTYKYIGKGTFYADLDRDGLLEIMYDNTIFKINVDGELKEIKEKQDGLGSWSWSTPFFLDVNYDGYPDFIKWNSSDYYYKGQAFLGNKDMDFSGQIELPGKPWLIDIDNNGYTDYTSYYLWGSAYKQTIIMGDANGGTSFDYEGRDYDINTDGNYLNDLNNDGKPDDEGSYSSGILKSAFTNEAPTAPTSVSVTQDEDYVVVSWSGATDRETPNMALRYNLSVKEKGATGDGSYIISPLNLTRDEAKAIDTGTMQYRYATRFPIPFGRFTVGKTYEVQVQTIDGWCEHSPFSTAVEFTPTAQTLLKMPEKAGEGQWVTFTLKDNSGESPVIDTDGGEIYENAILWSTPGIKTVKVTANGVTTSRQIQIIAYPNLSFYIPKKVLAGSVLNVELPDDFWRSDAIVKLIGSNGVNCTVEDNKGIVIMPQRAGNYEVQIVSEDDVFGKVVYTNKVEVIDFKPKISHVSATSDGCLILWDRNMSSEVNELLTGKVKIYRETAVTGRYEVVSETNLTDGQFTDNTSHPDIKSCRYMIAMPTTYGSESISSDIHGTVLLLVNQGMGNDINLHWNSYTGADVSQYIIHAGPSPDNLEAIETLSGSSLSYVHKRDNSSTTYYAISYVLKDHVSMLARRAPDIVAGHDGISNIVSSDEAYNVLMVQNISVSTEEGKTEMNADQTELHMKAIVTPALATLTRVEWSVIAGDNHAEIDQNGLLTPKNTPLEGTVTVQARAVDGSEVVGTINITVRPIILGDANNDGKVNITDAVAVVDYILGNEPENFNVKVADVNKDGNVNITDAVGIVDIILSK